MEKTILIIEDDNFLQGLEVMKLKSEKYNVLTASDGAKALEILASNSKIDLILLDLMLPGVDGFEVLEKIRATDAIKQTPVIVFSNLYEDKDRERASKLGVSHFMTKSNFTLDELIEKIKSLIG